MPWRDLEGPGPWRHWPIVVLFAGLTVTIAGVVLTAQLYRDSEERLLDQQTREAGAVLEAAIGRTETALADAAVLADATNGDPSRFATFASSMAERSGFVGAGVVTAEAASRSEVSSAGGGALIGPAELPESVADLVDAALAEPGTIRVALLEGSARRLGYATTSEADTTFVVYAETPLPDEPTRLGRSDGPFSDIDYGIYLGEAETLDTLLYTSVDDVPLEGAKSVITLPFADRGLTFASTAAEPLAGRFAQAAPWMLAAGGTAVSLLAALGTRSVLRRGRAAELLAARLAQLSEQQRAGIDTLRSSLLPRRLDAPPGVELHTGYWPADQDHEISGDFYDAFRVDDRRWALVIGDVCGKGPEAAALTGLTRHTIRAAARHLRSPVDVLR
jgi:Stage II sporulation protein E (SpoIIE)